MLTAETRGVYPVSPTPFLPNGDIDRESIARLCSFYRRAGAKGVTVLGLLGEGAKLDAQESVETVRCFAEYAEGLELIVGATAPGFSAMRYIANEAMAAGAVGVMVGPPTTLRTNEQVVGYYASVAEALGSGVPFIIQDYPLVNQVVFTTEVLREIVEKNPTCVSIKHEDWPGMDKLRTLKKYIKEGTMRKIPILIGNGGLFVDFEYAAEADGAMTGYPFPEMLVRCLELMDEGKRDEMQDLFDAHLPYLRYEAQPKIGVAIRKYVLCRRGVLAHETQRKPMISLSEGTRKDVDYLLDRLVRKTGVELKLF